LKKPCIKNYLLHFVVTPPSRAWRREFLRRSRDWQSRKFAAAPAALLNALGSVVPENMHFIMRGFD